MEAGFRRTASAPSQEYAVQTVLTVVDSASLRPAVKPSMITGAVHKSPGSNSPPTRVLLRKPNPLKKAD